MISVSKRIVKPLWVTILNICLAFVIGVSQAFATEPTPISSIADLLAVSGASNYKLMGNLDLSTQDADATTPDVQLADAVTADSPSYIADGFIGSFDGGNFKISGLTKPLFNQVGGVGSQISNLNLDAADSGVSGRGMLANDTSSGTVIDNVNGSGNLNGGARDYVGGLIGTQSDSGEIRDSTFSGNVTSTSSGSGIGITGGLVGFSMSPVINSSTTGSVSGRRYVGGLVGDSISDITNSHSTSDVTGSEEAVGGLAGGQEAGTIQGSTATENQVVGGDSVGGLVGYVGAANVIESFSNGLVTGTTRVGGLVGRTAGSYISQSYSNSDVTGLSNGSIGGLVGYADKITYEGEIRGIVSAGGFHDLSTTIESSYATGDVSQTVEGHDGGGVGGLVGHLYSGQISNSYSSGNVIGYTTVGGLVGKSEVYSADNFGLVKSGVAFTDYHGLIQNSYAVGTINLGNNGANRLGGLVGNLGGGKIVNSFATAGGLGIDASSGCDHIGGLVGQGGSGIIQNSFSYISGDISAGCGQAGGLVGSLEASGEISNSFAYVGGTLSGGDKVGGLVGSFNGDLTKITGSYARVLGGLLVTGADTPDDRHRKGTKIGYLNEGSEPIDFTEGELLSLPALPSILSVVNTDYVTEPFAISSCFISGRPYLTALRNSYSSTCSVDEEASPRINFSFLITRAQDGLSKSVGFEVAKSDLGKLEIALLEQVKDEKSAPIIGAKLFSNQSLTTSLSVGTLLQLEINFEANKSLQMWVKSLDGKYVLVGNVAFNKDGTAVLPGIELKKSGQYQLIFVNSDKKDLTQPELVNKVSGLTVYVN